MKTNCFIIKWEQLPEKIQSQVSRHGLLYNCLIDATSDFAIDDYRKGMESIENLRLNTKHFCGTLEEFIDDFRLDFDVWFINQKFDLDGVDRILIEAPSR